MQLHLIQSELAMAPDHPEGGSRVNHVSFDCYDLDAVEARIKEAGIPYNRVFVPVGEAGINQIFFQDPDMHWIEMCDCQRFNDFVFGAYDEKRGEELRRSYLEGVEPKGTFVASLIFMLLSQNMADGTAKRVSALRDLFNIYSQGDDAISLADLEAVMSRLSQGGRDTHQICNLLKRIDVDKDGDISFDEFHKYLAHEILDAPDQQAVLREVFSAVDTDSTGSVTREEFTQIFRSLLPQQLHVPVERVLANLASGELNADALDVKINRVFDETDVDHDGTINLAEFSVLYEMLKNEIRTQL